MKAGRPTKLEPERIARLMSAIKGGNYLITACTYAGLDQSTVLRWAARGKREKAGAFYEFYRALELAKAEAEMVLVARWREHTPHEWKASQTMLRARYPERWGFKDAQANEVTVKITHNGSDNRSPKTARRTKRNSRVKG